MNTNTTTQTGKTEIPQHILDFCNRVYPPTLGSAYDSHRAHLISKRMQVERELVGRNVLGSPLSVPTSSIPSTASERTVAPTSQNESTTNPQQISYEPETNQQQIRNESDINAKQNPPQNVEPAANEPAPTTRKFKRRGPDSAIDSLPSETQDAIAKLLNEYSLDRVAFILSKPGPHGPALEIDRLVLHRFRHRLLREEAHARALETRSFVTKLLGDPHAPEDELAAAIRHIFQARLLEEVIDPKRALADMLKALETSERYRKNDLATRRPAAKQTAQNG